jgi:hypothetical protein
MRKKQNYQRTDYAQNGELMCFGLSEHSLTELVPTLSEKAKKDIDIVKAFLEKKDQLWTRPSYKSDWSLSKDHTRMAARLTLGLLFIRELPIKSFVTR